MSPEALKDSVPPYLLLLMLTKNLKWFWRLWGLCSWWWARNLTKEKPSLWFALIAALTHVKMVCFYVLAASRDSCLGHWRWQACRPTARSPSPLHCRWWRRRRCSLGQCRPSCSLWCQWGNREPCWTFWRAPPLCQGGGVKEIRHKHTIMKTRSLQRSEPRDADCVPHCRKIWSPVALRMSCSSSLVAAAAMLAAAMCRKPWLASNVSLLMPPVGSMVLVWSTPPPWLHLPYCQQVVRHTAFLWYFIPNMFFCLTASITEMLEPFVWFTILHCIVFITSGITLFLYCNQELN